MKQNNKYEILHNNDAFVFVEDYPALPIKPIWLDWAAVPHT